jgi:hypothetical protein
MNANPLFSCGVPLCNFGVYWVIVKACISYGAITPKCATTRKMKFEVIAVVVTDPFTSIIVLCCFWIYNILIQKEVDPQEDFIQI